MNSNCLLYEEKDGVAQLTLNRPDVLNSFNGDLAESLHAAILRADKSTKVRAILLRGAGKGFCAGQDLDEITGPNAVPVETILRDRLGKLVLAIRNTELPFVCAVHGAAAGAGANIALCCDIVLAAEDAVFIQAFVRVGLIPDSAGTFFLPRLLGLGRASALAMLGEKISGAEAERIGMIYKAVPEDQLSSEALDTAHRLAGLPTRAIGLMKRAFNKSLTNSLEEQLDLELQLQSDASKSADHAEGLTAFLEKRKPNFSGS